MGRIHTALVKAGRWDEALWSTQAGRPFEAAPSRIEPRRSVGAENLKPAPHIVSLTERDELARERLNTLAIRAINLSAQRGLRTLLVTSARKGEGKTTIALGLAWSLAGAPERRVLVLDADLRGSSVSGALGLPPQVTWIDILERNVPLEEAIVRIDPKGLYLLAGSFDGRISIAELMASPKMELLLSELSFSFEFVIIDSPPVLDFAEAQRAAIISDGTILVVWAGQTHYSHVADALKLIPKERRLGVVLNQAGL
jgi:Mrp family chromosome partitioning ATPase